MGHALWRTVWRWGALADASVRVVAATPHLREDHPELVPAEFAERCEALDGEFAKIGVGLKVVPAGGWSRSLPPRPAVERNRDGTCPGRPTGGLDGRRGAPRHPGRHTPAPSPSHRRKGDALEAETTFAPAIVVRTGADRGITEFKLDQARGAELEDRFVAASRYPPPEPRGNATPVHLSPIPPVRAV